MSGLIITKVIVKEYSMEKLPQISEAEYEIMKIIWADYPISTNDVCEKANLTHSWNQKTIHTLLTRLNAKKVISYDQRGRMYYYYPLISQKKYLEQENRLFLNRFYNGEMAPMLSSLLSDSEIPDSELQNLYDMIQTKLKSGDKQ